jgi:hypothetical protein
VDGVSKIDWSMDGDEWLDGVGVAGAVDPSLNVVNMNTSAVIPEFCMARRTTDMLPN